MEWSSRALAGARLTRAEMPIQLRIEDQKGFLAEWQHDHAGADMRDALRDIARYIRDEAVLRAPGDTKRAVDVDVVLLSNNHVRINVGLRRNPRHAVFVHQGTGIFGEFRRPIIAKKVFAFQAGGKMVFARMTEGQRAQPFLREAIDMAEMTYVPFRIKELGIQVSRKGYVSLGI